MAKFEVMPAVDIMGGKCVRLLQGRFDAKTTYDEAPASAALRWEKLGATRLHVVDLDGAKTGKFLNIPIIKDIASKVKIPIQVGGGLRTKENVEELLGAGIDRVIMGTSVIESPALVKEMSEKYGERIAVSVDARGGRTAIKGWQLESDRSPADIAAGAKKMGVGRFIYTDISRDGMMEGPNIEGIRAFAGAVKAAVIASGGISSYKDIEEIKKLSAFGIEGCIIGKALYNGAIDLKRALEYNSI